MTIQKTENALTAFLNGAITENDILTRAEMQKIEQLNAAHGYGVDRLDFMKMVWRHQEARAAFNIKTMAKIEYRLTDINYHTICKLMHNGEYEAAVKEYDR